MNFILKASEYITKLLDCIGEHSGGNIYRGNFVEWRLRVMILIYQWHLQANMLYIHLHIYIKCVAIRLPHF